MENYLAKYKPEVALFSQPQFTIAEDLEPREKAFATWRALVIAKKNHEGLFLVIGMMLKRIRDEKMYIQMDYTTFSEFLASEELDFSREKAYMCIKTYEYYIEYLQLDPERVGKMNISKLAMMVPLLKGMDDKKEIAQKIDELSGLRHGDFVREVKAQTNYDGKPSCYWSNEMGKWIVAYHPDITYLQDLGVSNVQTQG